MNTKLALLAAPFALAGVASAQVVVTNATTTYTQNFDTLSAPSTPPGGNVEANGTAGNWADNTANVGSLTINGTASSTRFGLVGWYTYATTDRDVDFTAISGAGTVNRIWGNTGSSTGSRLYSYSVAGTNSVNDKAFGALAGASSGNYIIGLRLTNNTGANITEVSVAYTGEQWRDASITTARTMSFGYQLGSPANLNSGTWTGVSALNFTSPILSGTNALLDGNAPANRVSISSTAIGLSPSTPWTPGNDIWLRWVIPTSGGAQGLAIDDLSVSYTAIPEPSAAAALIGSGVLGLVALRRSRFRLSTVSPRSSS